MSQHFLHSAASRDFSIFDATDLNQTSAHRFLSKIRWGDADTPGCPKCGVVDKHYFRQQRLQWRCRDCNNYFSVTTGTVFQDRKVSLRALIVVAFLYCSVAEGISALELARTLGVSVKTAFVILSKLREVLVRNANLTSLEGLVQIDGAHFCAKPRKPNRRRKVTAAQIEERLSAKKSTRASSPPRVRMSQQSRERQKNRRVILGARSVSPARGEGALRTIVGVALHENQAAGMGFARRALHENAVVWTDENSAYSQISKTHKHETVNHGEAFVGEDGVNDNQAEAFNSRMRRAEYGVFHGFRPKYLADYLWEFAWRDDSRRVSMREKLERLLELALNSGRSQWWTGYWQGCKRQDELLFAWGHREHFVDLANPMLKANTSFRRSAPDQTVAR